MLRFLIKLLKWTAILIFSFYFLAITIFGFKKSNSNGSWDFYWSGIEGLWDADEEFGFWLDKKMIADYDGLDGPYLIHDTLYHVDMDNVLHKSEFNLNDTLSVKVNNETNDSFSITIHRDYIIETETYPLANTLIAISDIEGNFNAFSSFLIANKVIDNHYNWIFGNGSLVLNGDFIDRGNDVTQVLWLIYKLDEQSKKYGGKVHFILGNHEIMNFQGNWGYNKKKYIKIAEEISKLEDWDEALRFLFSDNSELGNWLRTKHVIEKIGDYIFVHAGLHPEILDFSLKLDEINSISRKHWDNNLYNYPTDDRTANFLIGRKGPFWYRGLVEDYKEYYSKISEDELDDVLNFYDAKKMVIGHTVVNDISTDFNGKIIRIDLEHGKTKNSGKTKGLLIENGIEYKIDDLGNKEKL